MSSKNKNVRFFTESELNKYLNKKGGGSDYLGLFHSHIINGNALDAYQAPRIDNSPLFKPFDPNATLATGTTGIVPVGQFYLNQNGGRGSHRGSIPSRPSNPSKRENKWIKHVKEQSKKLGISYKDAMKNPNVKELYHRMKSNENRYRG